MVADTDHVRLVGDIGGTNARFAILSGDNLPQQTATLRCSNYASLTAAIGSYMETAQIASLHSAAIAVATPIVGDRVKLTNNQWSFSQSETRVRLGLDALYVVNDFTALALSVPYLEKHFLQKIGGGDAREHAVLGVIGPGTGLGVSGLIYAAGSWHALNSEGGHVSLGVRKPREIGVYELLNKQYGHVSAERFLSGPGLQNICAAIYQLDGLAPKLLSPQEITQHGITGKDRVCREALDMFCDLLGSCAGNLALTLGSQGGVFIGGGIVPKLAEFFIQSGFRESFEAKGRMQSYLQRIPTYVITAPYPALTGVAQLLTE